MLKNTLKRVRKGDLNSESPNEILNHYTNRNRDSGRSSAGFDPEKQKAKEQQRARYASPDPTSGNSNFSWAKTKLTGGIETVNVKHRAVNGGTLGRNSAEKGKKSDNGEEEDVFGLNAMQSGVRASGKFGIIPGISNFASTIKSNVSGKRNSAEVNASESIPIVLPVPIGLGPVEPQDLQGSPGSVMPKMERGTVVSDSGSLVVQMKEDGRNMSLPDRIHAMKSKYISAIHARSERNARASLTGSLQNNPSEKESSSGVAGKRNLLQSKGLGKDNFAFKEAMLEKYNRLGMTGMPGLSRKDSSFNPESCTVVFLGPAKSGKTTLYKEMLSLTGLPPNYARAYIPTREAEIREVQYSEKELTVVDIGGAAEYRVDWRFHLNSADLVLFVVALDEYDKVDKEGKNCLQSSIDLFDSLVNNMALLDSRVVLVLNKADKFKKKLCEKNVPLNVTGKFPSAPMTNDYDEGVGYIMGLFDESINLSEHAVDIEVVSAIDGIDSNDMLRKLLDETAKGQQTTKWKNLL